MISIIHHEMTTNTNDRTIPRSDFSLRIPIWHASRCRNKNIRRQTCVAPELPICIA